MDDLNHGTFNGDISKESDFKSPNKHSEGPTGMLPIPTTEQTLKKNEDAQTTYDSELMEKNRKRVAERIAAWSFEAGIPFDTVCLESFELMLEAVAQFDPGLRGPSPDDLDGPLLQRQVVAINDSIEALKKSWASDGCSILVDCWNDFSGNCLLNLAVHCSQGVSFLRSINMPHDDNTYLFQVVDSCVEEVGEKNVVQVVSNLGTESDIMGAKMLTTKRPSIFWTHCSAWCIDSMFSDLHLVPLIMHTISRAKSLTAFIYGETRLLDMMRQFTNQHNLLRVGISEFTTCYLNLKSLYDNRIGLKTMFISKEWEDSKWSTEAVGKKFYNLVVSNEFWIGVLYVMDCFEPLVEVRRRMGSVMNSMGFVHGDLANAKREIALRCGNKEELYLPIWSIINYSCDSGFNSPLHLAGYYFNPFFHYRNKHEIENTEIFSNALIQCMRTMYQDQSTQQKIASQLELYRTALESFRRAHPTHAQMSFDPVSWWELHGGAAKELKTMALRILRLTCGSLACERSWIQKLHDKKPSWITSKRFNDSAFVMVNRRLKAKAKMRDRDPVLSYLPGEDEPYEWLVCCPRS